MFDASIRTIIDPTLDRLADICISMRLTANKISVIGFGFGVLCCFSIIIGGFGWALLFLCLNRLCDGIDGAVARKKGVTDFGGYLDIVLDFLFYALFPLSFAIFQPSYGLAACFLIVSFVGTGTSFLAYAILQAKYPHKELKTGQQKSIFYLGGLTEGTETIALFIAICLFPNFFVIFAYGFGILCWITTAQRILMTYTDFADIDEMSI